jgi:Ribbon-helix-helix protein, copG family
MWYRLFMLENRRQIAVQMPDSLMRRFKSLVAAEGTTQSTVIRELIIEYVKTAKMHEKLLSRRPPTDQERKRGWRLRGLAEKRLGAAKTKGAKA